MAELRVGAGPEHLADPVVDAHQNSQFLGQAGSHTRSTIAPTVRHDTRINSDTALPPPQRARKRPCAQVWILAAVAASAAVGRITTAPSAPMKWPDTPEPNVFHPS